MCNFDLKVSELAEQDLLDLWKYISDDSEEQANKFIREIREYISSLLHFPNSGVQKNDIYQDIRVLVLKGYNIFYFINEDLEKIIVARVLHGSKEIFELL